MRKYYDWDFARGRLTNTIINFDGRAHLVVEVDPNQKLFLRDMEEGKMVEVDIEDERVSHIRPKVGFVNVPRSDAIFVKLMPERRWKQGVPLDHLPRIPQEALGASLNGVYNSFRRSLRSRYIKAFHTYWAVGRGILFYKGKPVGKVGVDGAVEFDQGKVFLKEAFEEVVR